MTLSTFIGELLLAAAHNAIDAKYAADVWSWADWQFVDATQQLEYQLAVERMVGVTPTVRSYEQMIRQLVASEEWKQACRERNARLN